MKIVKPTLLVDKAKCLRNIKRMVAKAEHATSTLRPHFKTHFSAEIGQWYREQGVNKCTVSSVSMAKYFAENGWDDITIAFPYNPLESDTISVLAGTTKLNVLIESEESLKMALERIENPVGFFIKIDVGTHRTGVNPNNQALLKSLIAKSAKNVAFKGFLAHAGHTYSSGEVNQIREVLDRSAATLISLNDQFGGIISYGDTPSCSLIKDLSFADELRPGNFIFYDWMQYQIGSCGIDDIAVCLAAPVVAIHAERNEVVVYGGGVHLSKDSIIEENEFGQTQNCFGKVVVLSEKGWKTELIGHVDRLSQEHGILKLSDEQIACIKVGDLIGILPVHSCLTADLQGQYLSTEGHTIDKMNKTCA